MSWLTPAQTAGKTQPYLFTQGQAALNRSLFPCQDTPGARATWSATFIVERAFTAVMSAPMVNSVAGDRGVGEELTEEHLSALLPLSLRSAAAASSAPLLLPDLKSGGWHAFSGKMPHSVPCYLVAFAVGALRCGDVGPRSRVWTEEVLLSKSIAEFGGGGITERFIATGEALFGAYQWGRCDLLVMPNSFPFGGMENTTMMFLNPALLAGDQSLSDVCCHEIFHHWAGDLVTNKDWSRFFLNEGFTMYGQRRITSIVSGEAETALECIAGRTLLRTMMSDYGSDSPLSRLIVPLTCGLDPDETYTEAPYEKGFALVSYLRQAVGSDTAFDAWLKAYFTAFSFQSIGHADMLGHFFDHFPGLAGDWTAERWAKEEAEEASAWWGKPNATPSDLESCGILPPLPAPGDASGVVDDRGRRGLAYRPGYEFLRWLHAPGFPVYYPPLAEAASALSKPADELTQAWLQSSEGIPSHALASPSAFADLPTIQKTHFLDNLVTAAEASPPLPASLLARLDAAYSLSSSGNAEIRLRWGQLVATADYLGGLDSIRTFFATTGKLKYVTPIFRILAASKTAAVKDFALSLYASIRETLHPVVQSRVDGVMKALEKGES